MSTEALRSIVHFALPYGGACTQCETRLQAGHTFSSEKTNFRTNLNLHWRYSVQCPNCANSIVFSRNPCGKYFFYELVTGMVILHHHKRKTPENNQSKENIYAHAHIGENAADGFHASIEQGMWRREAIPIFSTRIDTKQAGRYSFDHEEYVERKDTGGGCDGDCSRKEGKRGRDDVTEEERSLKKRRDAIKKASKSRLRAHLSPEKYSVVKHALSKLKKNSVQLAYLVRK